MPYVEVWIDGPEDCNGTCDKAKELTHRRDRGVELLFDGDINGAIDILTSGKLPESRNISIETRDKFQAWKAGDLDGFAGPVTPTPKDADHD